MATEAFALSPISARAAEPTEADYDAIREAFMETARGRWFLGEYAMRNRNADTSMVLDAVARIEETLAAQRQPVVEDRLPEALVAIRSAIAEAQAAAGAAFDRAALDASLSPINRGVRIIREISWRWREIGADGRICDLIDSQLATIESACAQLSAIDPNAELDAAFALLRDKVERTGGGEAAPAAVRPAPTPEAPKTKLETKQAATDALVADIEAAIAAGAVTVPPGEMPQVDATPELGAIAVAPETVVEAMDVAAAPGGADVGDVIDESAAEVAAADMVAELSTEAAAEAEDDAILDLVAMEMAAPDADFDELPAEPVAAAEPAAIEPEVAEPIVAAVIAEVSEAIAATELSVPSIERPAASVAVAAPLPVSSPLPEPSLGAAVLASGMLQKPRPANDPLAPIRRMTQAEKIALFS